MRTQFQINILNRTNVEWRRCETYDFDIRSSKWDKHAQPKKYLVIFDKVPQDVSQTPLDSDSPFDPKGFYYLTKGSYQALTITLDTHTQDPFGVATKSKLTINPFSDRISEYQNNEITKQLTQISVKMTKNQNSISFLPFIKKDC